MTLTESCTALPGLQAWCREHKQTGFANLAAQMPDRALVGEAATTCWHAQGTPMAGGALALISPSRTHAPACLPDVVQQTPASKRIGKDSQRAGQCTAGHPGWRHLPAWHVLPRQPVRRPCIFAYMRFICCRVWLKPSAYTPCQKVACVYMPSARGEREQSHQARGRSAGAVPNLTGGVPTEHRPPCRQLPRELLCFLPQ